MKRAWRSGDVIELNLPMPVRLMQAHPKAEQLRNQVAVMRGPMLYCLESKDLPNDIDLNNVYIPGEIRLKPQTAADLPFGIVALKGEAMYRAESSLGTPTLPQDRTAVDQAPADSNDSLFRLGKPRTGGDERVATRGLE